MSPQEVLARNLKYAKPSDNYLTTLTPYDQKQFLAWVLQNKVPYDPSPRADYDMAGFWQALNRNDPRAVSGINPNDNQIHYPDYWKTPYHNSFSRESKWATENAPIWNEKDQLVLPDGTVVFDERAANKRTKK